MSRYKWCHGQSNVKKENADFPMWQKEPMKRWKHCKIKF